MQRTEGWPAGLYLATLSLAGRSDPDEFVRAFSGGNRFVGDYLTEEVLSRHTPEVREFITSISILDRFSASLCDHVVGTTASATLLHDLSRTNLFVVPLGDDGVWFRFHHLFAAVARSELEITHPERVRSLHARAAEWFRDHGHIDEAVRHSLAAGDARGREPARPGQLARVRRRRARGHRARVARVHRRERGDPRPGGERDRGLDGRAVRQPRRRWRPGSRRSRGSTTTARCPTAPARSSRASR